MEIKRYKYLNELIERENNGLIKIVTGLRRVGKSYLLFTIFDGYLKEKGIKPDHILKFILDDKRFKPYRNPDVFLKYVESKITGTDTHYILIDEVQMMKDFEEILNTLLHFDNVDVYVTGSNSRFLSKDVITEFRGRGDEIHVYPLSFAEFMSVYDGDMYKGFEEYSLFGGMPLVLSRKTPAQKMQYLKSLFTATYLKDIIARNAINNEEVLRPLLDIISSSVGFLTNPQRIANTFQSVQHIAVSPNTIMRYLDFLEDAYLIQKANRYDIRGRQYIRTPLKYYYTDTGLRNARLDFRQVEKTYLLENIIYLELCRRGFRVDVGVVETREADESGKSARKYYEIDFVANLGDKRLYIQSAYSIEDEDKYRQESKSLILSRDSFTKLLIVKDPVVPHRTEDGILILSIFDFLLKEDMLQSL
ncbi:MAG TPA: ATP-binding protein [Methanocorpusculum sp.]|nr:ATP-binding protein [Methanocorpusculum sp.]